MKRPDPRLQKAERLLAKVVQLISEIRAGSPPPRRQRKQRRRYRLPLILCALRDGAPLDVAAKDRDPRLPSRTILAKYRKSNPAFDKEASILLKERSRQSSRRKGRLTPTPGATEWARRLPGQRYDWNAIAMKIEAGATVGPSTLNRRDLPSHTLIMARRKADPIFGDQVARILHGRFGKGVRRLIDREDVLERVRRGAVIKSYPPEPGMPRKDQLDRERRENPQFNAAMIDAICEARRRKTNRRKLKKTGRNNALLLAEKAVPRSIDADLRGDIIGELSLLICEGQIAIDSDLAAAWKRCRTKLSASRWKEVSLNAPIGGTEHLTRLDLLSDETVRF